MMQVQVNTAALKFVVKEAKTLLALKKLYELDTEEKLLEFETSIIELENSLENLKHKIKVLSPLDMGDK